MNRREFLRSTGVALAWLALPPAFPTRHTPDEPYEQPRLTELPGSLGRIATHWRQAVRAEPSPEAEPVLWKTRDEIIVNLEAQRLTCLEGKEVVHSKQISSGAAGTSTPRGEHRVLRKRHTRRMTGGSGAGYYDLPGIAFPVYFTPSAHAIHGTYWHNDFVRPHSHGCVNASNHAAQWVFRWTNPVVPYDDYERQTTSEESTHIIVV